jgi:hypothetical protein
MPTTTSIYTRRKAQSAFEFMFIFAIFMAAVVIAFFVSSVKVQEVRSHQELLEIDDLLTKVSEKINTVWLEGEGFSTNLTLPATVAGVGYGMNTSSNYLVATVSGADYMKVLITQNVSGSLKVGLNTLTNMGDHIEVS